MPSRRAEPARSRSRTSDAIAVGCVAAAALALCATAPPPADSRATMPPMMITATTRNDGMTGLERHLAAERAPQRQPSVTDSLVQNDHSTQMKQNVANVLQRQTARPPQVRDCRAERALAAVSILVERVDDDQDAEDRPEQHVLPDQAARCRAARTTGRRAGPTSARTRTASRRPAPASVPAFRSRKYAG